MKKLFRGTIIQNIVVLADDENDAIKVIRENIREEIMNGGFNISGIQEIKKESDLPSGWNGTELPWGEQDGEYEQFILEILNEDGLYTNSRFK